MKHGKHILAFAAASFVLAACSSSQFQPPAVQQPNNGSPSYSDLQFVVGTANIYGIPGLNLVSTMRQPNGLTADLVNTPTLSGPFNLSTFPTTGTAGGGPDPYATIYGGGPSTTEKAANQIMGTSQNVRQGTPACEAAPCPTGVTPNTTTFGQSGGIERMGIFPGNSTPGGAPTSFVPYTDPIYVPTPKPGQTPEPTWVPWGGPPAYDDSGDGLGTRDGTHHALGQGVLGVFTGMTVFQLTPVAGQYTLSSQIPTGLNSSNQPTYATVSANATLNSIALLPTITAPVFVPDANSDGGGTLSVVLPPGATEGLVTIKDVGPGTPSNANCQGPLGTALAPVYYTIEFTSSGTITLPPTIGPNTGSGTTLTPSPSLCSAAANTTANGSPTPADSYVVQYFAMDYPLYEASKPSNLQQAPSLAGGNGQADITISLPSAATPY